MMTPEAWAAHQVKLAAAVGHLEHVDDLGQIAVRRLTDRMAMALFLAAVVEGLPSPANTQRLDRELAGVRSWVERVTKKGPPWSAASRKETAEALRLLLRDSGSGVEERVQELTAALELAQERAIAAVQQAIDVAVQQAIEALPPEQRQGLTVRHQDPRDCVSPEFERCRQLIDAVVEAQREDVEAMIQELTAPSSLPEAVAEFEEELRAKVATQLELRARLRRARQSRRAILAGL